MKEIIDDQLKKGMISANQSPFTSPAFLVPKPGGKWRLVIDFRRLNQSVEKSSWPIPKMADILNKLAGSTYLSSLDLVDGFHQCSLHESSRKYTAFVTSAGVYEYNVHYTHGTGHKSQPFSVCHGHTVKRRHEQP